MTGKRRSKSAGSTDRELAASLRRFVRARGASYLADPNVTSIGIGYKQTRGKYTSTVSVQFTVGQKVQPESLESLGSAALPEFIDIDGTSVPTDVLERSYRPAYQIVTEVEPPEAKVRHDPIVPGISIANVKVTAGTLGAIVYDKHDGIPLVLSNWHVLHGPDGQIGDTVVQPGPYDDNRVDKNRLGVLRRSYLGIAGDCAVCTIEDRRFDPNVLGIGVAPEELGDPELNDKVIKSGRTTGVTHGIVRRVDTIAKIDYGGSAGEQQIGCFEIGPDSANPADDHQISMGGDSGAAWIFKAGNGKPGKVLAGLHFGGESDGAPDDHALACLPASVFEKLEISITPTAGQQTAQTVAAGFDPQFLSTRVDVPALTPAQTQDAVQVDGATTIAYTHFSLVQSKSRRFARWVGWNIDGGSLRKVSRKGSEFVLDPRVPEEFQVGNELYRDNRIDRGHIARRGDLLWGPGPEADQANSDSFFYTNISPQLDDFNQGGRDGVWGQIEDAVFADVEVEKLRVSVFGGPVFGDADREYRGIAIPREFFKLLVFVEGKELKSRGFLLTQNLDHLESLDLDEFRTYQVKVSEIEERTGLRFSDAVRGADTAQIAESVVERQPLRRLDDIQW